MEVGSTRSWDELLPDALGLIFKNLPLQELLTVVPTVCKSWGKAVMGPYCWQEIDIEEWSNRSEPGSVERMLRMLIARSNGSIHKLCVSGLQNEPVFSLIAENARSLRILCLPQSNMSDSIVEKIAGSLSMITFLDLSYCYKISARSLEAIGKNCKLLEGLRRNMHPLIMEERLSQDNEEAHAIATTMPNLKRLETAYLRYINTIGALEIIHSCPQLEYLDLRGCWQVKLDGEYLKDKFPKLKVLGPYVVDRYERNNDYEDWSDFSDSLYDYESSDDENRFGELEFRFYQQFNEDATNGWPPSP
ncbi:PREDICTED: F-box protein FBW2-like [Ipomoea nil]|uniref:F-box protein FBW2-like n=1 Tax=Ipomoea nil TaxID=35883 RepID=UPI00090124C3|nr:PREDICTED: F-box protein FBW2-like [Ipomoea nil]XP_019152855.1 PREDICTED: F-box protein FBW2-like [Ipomoea nil]XP_019152856.1 PREDICTED: F-box protein FBW2-like [Ipomoea nil]XP_019152857.1 PREDICTED: F-box protein FBW2-like [Ipomoea nil]